MSTDADLGDVTGHEVIGSDGVAIGRAERCFRDDDSQRAEWAVVGDRFVPLFDARLDGETVVVAVTAEQVASSPTEDSDAGHLSRAQEGDLYVHYGYDFDPASLLNPGVTPVPLTDQEMSMDEQTSIDGDHDLRPGVLDSGVTAREQATDNPTTGDDAGEVAVGTSGSGTMMGNAGTTSAAGTAATTDLSERVDLILGSGNQSTSSDGDTSGSAMIDVSRPQE